MFLKCCCVLFDDQLFCYVAVFFFLSSCFRSFHIVAEVSWTQTSHILRVEQLVIWRSIRVISPYLRCAFFVLSSRCRAVPRIWHSERSRLRERTDGTRRQAQQHVSWYFAAKCTAWHKSKTSNQSSTTSCPLLEFLPRWSRDIDFCYFSYSTCFQRQSTPTMFRFLNTLKWVFCLHHHAGFTSAAWRRRRTQKVERRRYAISGKSTNSLTLNSRRRLTRRR